MHAEPIKPVPGPQLKPEDVHGMAILASRTHVNGLKDPALRIFTGNVTGRKVGNTFDTVHRDNRKPCGLWTVQAVITDGHVTAGTINEGIGSYRVYDLG
jgi:hypothetical protein